MRICVTYDELCTYSEYSDEEYGEWSEDYSSSVTGAYCIGDNEKAPYSSEKMVKILSYGYGRAKNAVGGSQDKAKLNAEKAERAVKWL
jgi:hypothetical protein